MSTGATFTVTLSDSTGTLSADEDGASTTTGDGTNTLTISGDLADVKSDLASLAYTGASTGFAATATDTIGISVDDGNGGNAQGTIGVTIDQALDETPVVEAPTSEFATTDTLLAITGVSLVGSDTPENSFTVIVSADSGTLGDTVFGASTVSGIGSGYLTISGDYADVNSDLSALTYIGARRPSGRWAPIPLASQLPTVSASREMPPRAFRSQRRAFLCGPCQSTAVSATPRTGHPMASLTQKQRPFQFRDLYSQWHWHSRRRASCGDADIHRGHFRRWARWHEPGRRDADGGALTVSGGSLTTTGSVDVAQGSLDSQ